MHPLDNPAWHALTGPHATVAERRARATRYDPAVAPFAALPDEPTGAAWDDLAGLVGPGGVAVLFRAVVTAPPGWEEVFRIPTVQMVATSVAAVAAADDAAVVLGPSDVPDMLTLVGRTHPGPFEPRTIELGEYLGIREGGRLVAMAGERMRLPGHVEISAVCTDPEHRRRGLATRLVAALAARIAERGDTPILHVVVENAPAISVYEALGFAPRLAVEVTGVRAVSATAFFVEYGSPGEPYSTKNEVSHMGATSAGSQDSSTIHLHMRRSGSSASWGPARVTWQA